MRPSINDEIRAAAEKNFRSISEELESRIDQSCECIVVRSGNGDPLRNRLMDAASRNGRTLEIEAKTRIENSFFMEKLLGDPQTYSLVMLIASDIMDFQGRIGKPWHEALDPASSNTANSVTQYIVDMTRGRIQNQLDFINARKENVEKYRQAVEADKNEMEELSQFVFKPI